MLESFLNDPFLDKPRSFSFQPTIFLFLGIILPGTDGITAEGMNSFFPGSTTLFFRAFSLGIFFVFRLPASDFSLEKNKTKRQ